MSVTYRVATAEFGEPVTAVTGKTTISSQDYGVSLLIERATEDGGAEAVTLVMSHTDAAELAHTLNENAALARFKEFSSRKAQP